MESANYESLKPVLFDSQGKTLTTGLFKETKFPNVKNPAPFSLKDWHDIYVGCNDPTEYQQAMLLLGSWSHWLRLRENQTLAAIFDEWQMEVEVRMRSEAVVSMVSHSKRDGGTAASRWLAEAGFNPKDMRNKKNKDREKLIQDRMASRVEEDYARLTEGNR